MNLWMRAMHLQGHSGVGYEAGLQGVHQVHILTHHLDPERLLPAQLLGPLRRAVTAVNDQVGAVPVGHAGLPQPEDQRDQYAQWTHRRSHAGWTGILLFFFKNTRSCQVTSSQLVWRVGTISRCLPSVRTSCPAAHLLRLPALGTFAATSRVGPGHEVWPGGCNKLHLPHVLRFESLQFASCAVVCAGRSSTGARSKSGNMFTARRVLQTSVSPEKGCLVIHFTPCLLSVSLSLSSCTSSPRHLRWTCCACELSTESLPAEVLTGSRIQAQRGHLNLLTSLTPQQHNWVYTFLFNSFHVVVHFQSRWSRASDVTGGQDNKCFSPLCHLHRFPGAPLRIKPWCLQHKLILQGCLSSSAQNTRLPGLHCNRRTMIKQ